jgi:hypothetical protein
MVVEIIYFSIIEFFVLYMKSFLVKAVKLLKVISNNVFSALDLRVSHRFL